MNSGAQQHQLPAAVKENQLPAAGGFHPNLRSRPSTRSLGLMLPRSIFPYGLFSASPRLRGEHLLFPITAITRFLELIY
jgi:hypothetical protein